MDLIDSAFNQSQCSGLVYVISGKKSLIILTPLAPIQYLLSTTVPWYLSGTYQCFLVLATSTYPFGNSYALNVHTLHVTKVFANTKYDAVVSMPMHYFVQDKQLHNNERILSLKQI